MAADLTEKLTALESFSFEDNQRTVEGPSPSILLNPLIDFNYEERNAFETRWAEETVLIQRLRDLLANGERVFTMIYTYRSCSMCVPQVRDDKQENRGQIYESTVAVLEGEVKKLKEFMHFHRQCIKFFGETVKRLSKKEEISEILKYYLIQLLDLMQSLDSLKNMKASLNNDFSAYKRASGFLRKGSATQDDQTQENQTLYLFLAYPNAITTNLKNELKECEEADKVLLHLAVMCVQSLETERYVLPAEKHCLLRVLPYAISLMDSDDPKKNVFKHKSLSMSTVSRWFKRYPIVTMFADMQMPLESAIRRTPHFDERSWAALVPPTDTRIAQEYELVHHIDTIRGLHNEYVARFSAMINEIRCYRADPSHQRSPLPGPLARDVVTTVLQGIQLISDWTARVLQQAAWKFANPNQSPEVQSELDYERVIKFNYKPEERSALIEAIAMIKGLARIFLKHDSFLSPIIRSSIHDELQDFLQVSLRDMLADMTKKKKTVPRNDLMQLRSMAADWLGGSEPLVDSAAHSKKSDHAAQQVQYPKRQVGPSTIQLDLMRDIVYGLLNMRKEFSSSQVKQLEEFYSRSLYWPYLLDFSNTVMKSSDMGDLWYREFYLELGKRLQFPIDMSLPSILVDHALSNKDNMSPELIEYALYPLDIYNDAASRALRMLNQRFLYDEVEAEVNLCFDQLLFKLSNQIYSFFKSQSSSILLDKPYRSQLESALDAGKDRFSVPKNRFEVLLSQRHVQLLGRTIDLNNLISQRVNRLLRQNVDHAISRFEASDLTSVVELDQMLINIKLTHALISKYLEVDPWELIIAQGNESTSIASFHNRVLLHVLFEIASDFGPNYNYNSITGRFIRTPCSFIPEVMRESMPKQNHTFLFGNKFLGGAYVVAQTLVKKFIGIPHIEAIVHLLGRTHLPMLVSECLKNLDLKIQSVIVPYVAELTSGMPASSKLPIHEYGSQGSHFNFSAKLKPISDYGDLRPEVLRHFKEMGNIVILMRMFDQCLKNIDLQSFVSAAPILGFSAFSTAPVNSTEDPSSTAPLYSVVAGLAQNIADHPSLKVSPDTLRELATNAWRADKYYRQADQTVSLFKTCLGQLNVMLDSVRNEWCGASYHPENGVMDVEGPYEFYRLWCALQFVCCMKPNAGEQPITELYGDGLNWAGCTIMHLLGQRHRFTALSFAYHTLNIEEAAPQRCGNEDVVAFLRNASLWRDLDTEIFDCLEIYMPVQTYNAGIKLSPPETLPLKYFVEMSNTQNEAAAGNVQIIAARKTTMLRTSPISPDAPPLPNSAAPQVEEQQPEEEQQPQEEPQQQLEAEDEQQQEEQQQQYQEEEQQPPQEEEQQYQEEQPPQQEQYADDQQQQEQYQEEQPPQEQYQEDQQPQYQEEEEVAPPPPPPRR